MKKLIAVLLLVLMSVSCTAGEEIDIEADLETFAEVYEDEIELPYVAPDLEKAIGGLTGESFAIQNSHYFFPVQHEVKKKEGRDSVSMYAYVDLKTGTSAPVCPDPLCDHDSAETCKYYDFQQEIWFTEYSGVFYTYRLIGGKLEIHRVDLQNDTTRLAYIPENMTANIIGYHDGKLYFYETLNFTEEKKTIQRRRISYIEDSTGEVTHIGTLPDDFSVYPRFMKDGKIYYTQDNKLGRMDQDFTNREEILKTPYGLTHWIWDDNTGELYFSSVNDERQEGWVYRYADGVLEKLHLPHDNIYMFTLTNDKIYYSPYDPIFHGINILALNGTTVSSSPTYHTYDYTGGKIYAAARENPSEEAELVYDNGGTFTIGNLNHPYVVFGEYLYADEIELTREVVDGMEFVYYNSAFNMSKIRIGLKDGSFTRISFE